MCPHRLIRVCATRADCYVSQQALTTREAKTVDTGKASGEATSTAWDKEYQGKVIYVPPPPHPCVRDAR